MKHVVIIGQGYVGLPLAMAAARSGLQVTGIERNPEIASSISRGRSHVDDISDGEIQAALELNYSCSTDEQIIASADVVVICVPTPLSDEGGPDLRAVEGAVDMVARNPRSGQTVILESTTYPGTTEEIVLPRLEAGGRQHGVDFYLAFSPERVDPGNPVYTITNTPKLVGGISPEATAKAAEFYDVFVERVVEMRGAKEAEMAKLLENTYRHVNIALVNEMAKFSQDLGIDIWDVIDGAGTKPFGYQAFWPGPGVGGHCIPIDPNYLSHQVRTRLGYSFRFVELAQEINSTMPTYVALRAQSLLNRRRMAMNGAKILLLGVTYKANIADQRESPATKLADGLLALGAEVTYYDPLVEKWEYRAGELASEGDLASACHQSDLVIMLQKHDAIDVEVVQRESVSVLDTRGCMSGENVERL